ncbi:MAG TPA: ADOP family duplicated permease [Acidobacteriota bacterium]|nr:ADOP family duplicated permease [Acidobacteriota bacterium]
MWARLRSWIHSVFHRQRFEDDLSSEFRHHLESRTRHLMQEGLEERAARLQARREFGDPEAVRQSCRQARGLYWTDEFRRHVSFALRLLRRHPTFAASVLLTLGLTIGANTAVFSIVDGFLIRPLPYPEPERLSLLMADLETPRGPAQTWSHGGRIWEVIRDQAEGLEASVFSSWSQGGNLAVGDWVRHVNQGRVGAGYFSVLGVQMQAGREFSPQEDTTQGEAVAILGLPLADRLFGGAQQALGQEILLSGQTRRIVGVLPAGFRSPYGEDVWTPLVPSRRGEGSGANYDILIRPAEGVTLEQARAQIGLLQAPLAEAADLPPEGYSIRYGLAPLQTDLIREIRQPLLILWLAVGLVLVIGCVNIAGLLLARLGRRRRELAVRASLGGGRAAVLRQMLTESLVLAALGVLLGVGLGYLGKEGLELLAQESFSLWQPVDFNLRVLAATALTGLLASLLFGILPAKQALKLDLRQALSQGGRGMGGDGSHRFRHLLVVTQVALSVILLIGAGLLLRTFLHLRGLDPGIDPAQVVAGKVSLADARYKDAESVRALYNRSLTRLRSTPGVEHAGVALTLPYERALNLGFAMQQGEELGPGQVTDVVYVTPGFFRALSIPLLQGRLFNERDDSRHPPVVLVNRAFVERYLGDRPVLETGLATMGARRQIVGVVGDVQHRPVWGQVDSPLGAVATLYVPAGQSAEALFNFAHRWFSPSWVVRSKLPLEQAASAIEEAVHSADPLLPFSEFQSMESVMAESWARQQLQAVLMLVLAALALLLAIVGLYGVISQAALQRRREMGIRMALGAGRGQAVLKVAWPGLIMALLGTAMGAAGAWSGMRVLNHLLTGVDAHDPLTYATVVILLLGVAALASLIPSLRLTRITPSEILRNE